ncbi:MAG: methyltransferase type 11, partial [Actinomycetota bacterium]|nr:methyltransferase type 11 [Actinomycetota bacterium]
MPAFVVVQRAPHEGPALLGEVLGQRERAVRVVRRHEGEPLDVDRADLRALVVLGGHEAGPDGKAAGVDVELALIAWCIDARVPVLALSSGARLLVRA